jgi:hypothetical protein
VDFFHIDTAFDERLYALVFLEHITQARNQLPPNTDQQPATIHNLAARRPKRTPIFADLINEHRYAA